MKAGLEKAQQLSGFAHSVPQTPELCYNPVTCHEAADVAEAMGREARGVHVWAVSCMVCRMAAYAGFGRSMALIFDVQAGQKQ